VADAVGRALDGSSTEALRSRVDDALEDFLDGHAGRLREADPEAAVPLEELRRVLRAGGKRLRPLFCYWGYRAAGGEDSSAILRASASLELLHTFAIIHDDIMDRSQLRRGRPASHVTMSRPGDTHFGVSAAILAGDLALALADELFWDSGFPPQVVLTGLRWYNRMRVEVVAGQYLDIAAARSQAVDESRIRRIAAMKSGGYTVEKPLLIGGALAGATPELASALSAYGMPLGEAFQLRDDVLGVFGEPEVTGKDTHSDLREGKRTILLVRALEAASPADRAFIDDNVGRSDLSEDDAEHIREIIRSTGALDSTVTLIEELAGKARAALERASVPEQAAAALGELAGLAAVRES
jgi:geranylgeranyl diphosphate synthase type I